jgi:hypothetical protein
MSVSFELVNQQGQVIGNQDVRLNPEFSITTDDIRFEDISSTVKFNGVRANDISDNLTIRIASVNGAPPQNARFMITAAPTSTRTSPPLFDTRDGKQYRTVVIGGRRWMAENLNYQPPTGNSWCYDNNNSNCEQYGRLYDWNYLVFMTGGSNAGKNLKAKSGWGKNGNGTDAYGFSALPISGHFSVKPCIWCKSNGYFVGTGRISIWWTATEKVGYFDGVYYRCMWCKGWADDQVNEDYDGKGEGFSVRCVGEDVRQFGE